ncbi:MAG TPA: hypothetical protein VN948_02340 [Terriglobales bacterium]|nr:hypothetical protein [Terriglobales bacterium]
MRYAVARTAVPPLIPYSGVAKDLNGKPTAGTVGITFLLYKQEQGGAPCGWRRHFGGG